LTQPAELSLVVRRRIDASPERLFEAWTTPSLLLSWWGPAGVRCTRAEVDLRVGGRYRLGNALPDGREVFIVGEFLQVEPPTLLVYTWWLEADALDAAPAERVSVRFEARGSATEVVVVHERIAEESTKRGHTEGWLGCLDALGSLCSSQ
jgi:uncharacterized protein YndB with AHSA1/START domain